MVGSTLTASPVRLADSEPAGQAASLSPPADRLAACPTAWGRFAPRAKPELRPWVVEQRLRGPGAIIILARRQARRRVFEPAGCAHCRLPRRLEDSPAGLASKS